MFAKAVDVVPNGSGDTTFDWVAIFCWLVLAMVGVLVWTAAARVKSHYALYKWFHLFLRFSLGTTFLTYGLVKTIPMQMPYPTLNRLLEPYGNFSPMGVLWASIGASPAYEMFTGLVELSAGILLLIPWTSRLGSLLALAAAGQVFTLNMTSDVPVKTLSFHMVLMALLILLPDLPRLAAALLTSRPVGPPEDRRLFASPVKSKWANIAQVVFLVVSLSESAYFIAPQWNTRGSGAPKSPLYGIWDIEKLTIDGKESPGLVTDRSRWRRLIFEAPTRMSLQRMDDTFLNRTVNIDTAKKVVQVTDKDWTTDLTYERSDDDHMTVDGAIQGKRYGFVLKRFDREKFLLVSRGFHWIQEAPFNR